MSDHWYYADKERPVGPFSLRELKNVLQGLPNWKDTLVWRKGFDKWQEASSISDLYQLEPVPPPIPRTQNLPGRSANEQTTPLGRPTSISRKTVLLVVGSYFLGSLAFAVFLKLKEPFATWGKLFDVRPLAEIIGSATGLFFLSGLIPLAVWAFWRFRAEKAIGPLFAWLALLVIIGYMAALGHSFDLEQKFERIGRTILTGKQRRAFVSALRRGCVEAQRRDPLNRQVGVTDAQISAYCDCYANALASNLSEKLSACCRHAPTERASLNSTIFAIRCDHSQGSLGWRHSCRIDLFAVGRFMRNPRCIGSFWERRGQARSQPHRTSAVARRL